MQEPEAAAHSSTPPYSEPVTGPGATQQQPVPPLPPHQTPQYPALAAPEKPTAPQPHQEMSVEHCVLADILQRFSAGTMEPGQHERLRSANVISQGTQSNAHGTAAQASSMGPGTSTPTSMQQPGGLDSNMHTPSDATPVPPTSPTPLVTGTGAVGQAAAVGSSAKMGILSGVATRDSITNYGTQAVALVTPAPGAPVQVHPTVDFAVIKRSQIHVALQIRAVRISSWISFRLFRFAKRRNAFC